MTADQREQALAALDMISVAAENPAVQDAYALVRAALTPAPLPADLSEIQARADAATPGPWTHNMEAGYEDFSVDNPDGHPVARCGYGPYEGSTDAEFIAHARTDVPALVVELAELRARPTLTAEDAYTAHGAIVHGADWPLPSALQAAQAKLRAIAEGAGSINTNTNHEGATS